MDHRDGDPVVCVGETGDPKMRKKKKKKDDYFTRKIGANIYIRKTIIGIPNSFLSAGEGGR